MQLGIDFDNIDEALEDKYSSSLENIETLEKGFAKPKSSVPYQQKGIMVKIR